jgi:hypothetical protein
LAVPALLPIGWFVLLVVAGPGVTPSGHSADTCWRLGAPR